MQAPVAPDFYVEEQRPHLGGYIVGGDPATFYPQLWDWLVNEHGVKTVIDVGCGEGHAARHFADHGCDVIGIDGVFQLSENWHFHMHDYTEGPWPPVPRGNQVEGVADLVWSCEFVEHVPEEYVPNFLPTFQEGRMVAMTHAEPGQLGHHHVNCRSQDYWAGVMAAAGFSLDVRLSNLARQYAAMNQNPINHFVRSGLVFRAT